MTYSPKTNKLAHLIKNLIYLGSAVFMLGGFLLSVRAASSPVVVSSIESVGGTTSGTTHTTTSKTITIRGFVTSSTPITKLDPISNHPSVINNLVSNSGNWANWTDTVTLGTSNITANTTFTVTFTPSSGSGYLPATTVTITVKPETGGSTGGAVVGASLAGCKVTGTVTDALQKPVARTQVMVSSYSPAGNNVSTAVFTDSSGQYNASIDTHVNDTVLATAGGPGTIYAQNSSMIPKVAMCPAQLNVILFGSGGTVNPITNPTVGTSTTPVVKTITVKINSETKTSDGAVLTDAKVIATSTRGQVTAVSGEHGQYSLSIVTTPGSQIQLIGTRTGYDPASASFTLSTSAYDGQTLDSSTNPPVVPILKFSLSMTSVSLDAKVYGTVSGIRKDGSQITLAGATVEMVCSGGRTIPAIVSDANGQYVFSGLDLVHPNCTIKATTHSAQYNQDFSSAPSSFVLNSGPKNVPIAISIYPASLTLNVLYPDFCANFGRVYPGYQPVNDKDGNLAQNCDRVAFPIKFTQNNKTEVIPPASQTSKAFVRDNINTTLPYTIHIDANITAQSSDGKTINFGNKEFNLTQTPTAGLNIPEIKLSPNGTNLLTVHVTDTLKGADQICIKVKRFEDSSISAPKWFKIDCLKSDMASSTRDGSYYTFSVTTASFLNPVGAASGKSSAIMLPPNAEYTVSAGMGILQDSSDPKATFSFDRYFGSERTVTLSLGKAPVTQYTIVGATKKSFSVKSIAPQVLKNLQVVIKGPINNGAAGSVLCDTISDNNGNYSCPITLKQFTNSAMFLGGVLGVYVREPGAAANDLTKINEIDLSEAKKEADGTIKNDIFLLSEVAADYSANCESHPQTSTSATFQPPITIEQFYFCGSAAKALYADASNKWIWTTITDQIATLRHDHDGFKSHGSLLASPPEVIIDSSTAALIDVNNLDYTTGSCWPASKTKNVASDEAGIKITTGMIKNYYLKSGNTAQGVGQVKENVVYAMGLMKDWIGGTCSGFTSSDSTHTVGRILDKWKTKGTMEQDLLYKTITASNFKLPRTDPSMSNSAAYASIFTLAKLHLVDFNATIGSFHSGDTPAAISSDKANIDDLKILKDAVVTVNLNK